MKRYTWMIGNLAALWMALLCIPLAAVAQDVFEPDNSHLQANALGNGESQTHTIHAVGDADVVRIEVTGGGAQNFEVGSNNGTELTMVDASLQSVGTAAGNGPGGSSIISFPWFLAAGVYYVQAFDQEGGVINGYQLWCSWSTPAADTYEPDNSRDAARRILNGQVQTRSTHAVGDEDWVKFTVDSYGARNVRLETSGSHVSTELFLYNRQGAQLGYGEDVGGGASHIDQFHLAPGTYFVKIREAYNDNVMLSYQFKASWRAGDAWENDNVRGRANTIANGATQRHNIHRVGDVDWVKFVVPAGGVRNMMLETRNQGVIGNTELFLYNARRVRIAYDDDSGEGRFSRIRRAALPSGTYYALVREKGNNAKIRRYGLELRWTAP